MSSGEPEPEWTPPYLLGARAHAAEVALTGTDTDVLVAAIRELTAEVRALRHQLAGGSPPETGGALGAIANEMELRRRMGG